MVIECCFFDLDGTLINSLQDIANATNNSLKDLGFLPHSEDCYKKFVGNGADMLVQRVLPENMRTNQNKIKMRNLFDKYYSENCLEYTKPYPEIENLLNVLKNKGIKLAVITNKPDFLAKKIVSNLFPEIFDKICGNTNKFLTKPSPQLTLHVAESLNVKSQNCAFIGDSDVDIKTGINAKMLSIGVSWGFRDVDELTKSGAKHIAMHPLQILDFI